MTAMLALDHVQIAMPVGGEEAARAFFGRLLGLSEIPKPADMALRGGCWFAVGLHQLHLGVEAEFRPMKKAHIALATDGVMTLRRTLDAAGYATTADAPVDDRNRFFTHDPFGNRIEFIESAK